MTNSIQRNPPLDCELGVHSLTNDSVHVVLRWQVMHSALIVCFVALWGTAHSERPNIVIVLADDMGYSDLGCYGGEIDTPRLDALASNGLRFAQFYNTARCCPTRAALLTGLYQHQVGVGHMTQNRGTPAYQGFLNDRCVTIAEVLRPAGYATMTTGKWHVGSRPGHWPLDRGFDRYYGCPVGGGFYFKKTMARKNRFLLLDDQRVGFPDNGYVTDLFTDYALSFVSEAVERDKPFFLYLAHIAPHWPLQAKPSDIQKYATRYTEGWNIIRRQRYERQQSLQLFRASCRLSPAPATASSWNSLDENQRADMAHRMAVYAAQIDSIDQNMGRLIDLLDRLEQLDNTVIFFLSDNGCSAEGGPGGFRRGQASSAIGSDESYASAGLEWANVSDSPFRKFKQFTHEGGIASPLIVHWPRGIHAAGEVRHQVSHVIDLWPTCIELAAATPPTRFGDKPILPAEGVSLVPAFNGKPLKRSDSLYWEHQGNRAIRDANWKLVASKNTPWELYNLDRDRSETDNVADQFPHIVQRLSAKWQSWSERCGVVEF